jgi:hypothetical protein
MDEALAERIEEARSVLEKLENVRRDDKNGTCPFDMTIDSLRFLSCLERMDNSLITQIVKLKLMSSRCQNQGYVLDGYPKTCEQADSLFGGKYHFCFLCTCAIN